MSGSLYAMLHDKTELNANETFCGGLVGKERYIGMEIIAPTSCVVAEKLHAIEKRLRTKASVSAKQWFAGAYSQAASEVQHERLFEHFAECVICQHEQASMQESA